MSGRTLSEVVAVGLHHLRRLASGSSITATLEAVDYDPASPTACRVRGWAQSVEGSIVSAEVLVGGTPCGALEVGRPRPDVARVFGDVAGSANAGFSGTVGVPALSESTRLTVRLTDSAGNVRVLRGPRVPPATTGATASTRTPTLAVRPSGMHRTSAASRAGLCLLHAIHDFPPHARAGSELYALTLCQTLQSRGHDVTVLCARYEPSLPHGGVLWRTFGGLAVAEITNNWAGSTFESSYHDPVIAAALESVLEEVRPDVLHVHNLLNLTLDLPARARARRIPVVATLHDYTLVCPSGGQRLHQAEHHVCRTIEPERCVRCFAESPFGARLASNGQADRRQGPLLSTESIAHRLDAARRVFDDVTLFVAPSEALAAEYIGLGLPEHKMEVADYGFPAMKAPPLPAPARHLRLGFVGTLAHHKGVHVLLEAMRQLPVDRVEVLLFGDTAVFPDYVAELRRRATGLRVEFAGGFTGRDVGAEYGRFDVLVVPSIWLENSPLVIHEAQMSGRPVVGARIGGIPGLIRDGVDGLLFEANEPDSLARALRRLLDEPGLLRRLSEARPAVRSIDADVDAWERRYRLCVTEARQDRWALAPGSSPAQE